MKIALRGHESAKFAVVIAVCLGVRSSTLAAQTDSQHGAVIANFLGKHCLQCHDADTADGEREFESFALPITSEQQLITANEIIDQVTLREMPPEDAEQPTDEQRLNLVGALRDSIRAARSQFESSGARTVMRRLSNREYENTLATLFGRRVETLGLTADFPKDQTSHHMDNIGESLVTSGFLLDQYLQAATRLVDTRLG
ncbi:MAG TPA: DUF1587 domain-containing protein, partial [Fuerstia sp.]|nr:DUF1587 domain-containing protein [Fuerstiella sp.]